MSNFVKTLDASSATAQAAQDLLKDVFILSDTIIKKSAFILSDTIIRKSTVEQDDLKPY